MRVDRAGTPPAYRPTGANCQHGAVFDGPIDAVPAIMQPNRRRRKRPAKLHADRPYDIPAAVEGSPGAALRSRSHARAQSRASARGATAGWRSARWSGSPKCRRLATRYERREGIHAAFDSLGCPLIGFKTLTRS